MYRAVPLLRADLLRVQLQIMLGASTWKTHVKGYEEIADAVLAGTVKKVEKSVHRHVQRTRELVRKIPDSAFPRDF
ncbi:MAG: hypothetical protein AB7U63_12645 [Porticoccaceae bacterium]